MTRRLQWSLVVVFFFTSVWIVSVVPAQELRADVRPAPMTVLNAADLTVDVYFTELQQGRAGLLRLSGVDLTAARALFIQREFEFVEVPGDGWYALIVASIDAQPRDYTLSILARGADGADRIAEARVNVTTANFPRLNFEVGRNLAYLTDPEIERGEFARLDALIAERTPERLWDDERFRLPIDTPFTSAFGQYRILNQNVQTRHTGWDQTAPVGTPVGAIGAGRVVFADRLEIRGNYVMIDHGWGIYSGYAHLSQVNVERGQTIAPGQIIAMSGNTGRSQGPHLHWEVAVNGEWVDSVDFLEMWLP